MNTGILSRSNYSNPETSPAVEPLIRKATGRFAPTPSGPLHFGSLVTALASYCHARKNTADWVIRIEDVDTPRVVKGSVDIILSTLEAFGFEWDGDIIFQSQRFDAYQQALQQLKNNGVIYACNCSRKKLHREKHQTGPLGLIYPGHCRDKNLQSDDVSLRLNTQNAETLAFNDLHFGHCSLNLAKQVGDMVMLRRDHIYAYHLAVVVDDAAQQITQIVRGADLLQSTCLHLYLNQLLGFEQAEYLHLPLVKNARGDKLSKQTGAQALDTQKASELLIQALEFLGQPVVAEMKMAAPNEILQHAIVHWNPALLPAV
jgi:glutamyl-Q tRNA(Asp) synthetase